MCEWKKMVGNGSALRIRPEPSKSRNTVAGRPPEAAPHPESSWSPLLAQPNQEVKDTDSTSPRGDNTIDFIDQNRQKKLSLYPWWLPRLKYVPISQQECSWKGEGNPRERQEQSRGRGDRESTRRQREQEEEDRKAKRSQAREGI